MRMDTPHRGQDRLAVQLAYRGLLALIAVTLVFAVIGAVNLLAGTAGRTELEFFGHRINTTSIGLVVLLMAATGFAVALRSYWSLLGRLANTGDEIFAAAGEPTDASGAVVVPTSHLALSDTVVETGTVAEGNIRAQRHTYLVVILDTIDCRIIPILRNRANDFSTESSPKQFRDKYRDHLNELLRVTDGLSCANWLREAASRFGNEVRSSYDELKRLAETVMDRRHHLNTLCEMPPKDVDPVDFDDLFVKIGADLSAHLELLQLARDRMKQEMESLRNRITVAEPTFADRSGTE